MQAHVQWLTPDALSCLQDPARPPMLSRVHTVALAKFPHGRLPSWPTARCCCHQVLPSPSRAVCSTHAVVGSQGRLVINVFHTGEPRRVSEWMYLRSRYPPHSLATCQTSRAAHWGVSLALPHIPWKSSLVVGGSWVRTQPPQLRRGCAPAWGVPLYIRPLDGGGPGSCAGREDAALRQTLVTTQSLTRGDSRVTLIDQIAARVHCLGRSRYDDDHGVDPLAWRLL